MSEKVEIEERYEGDFVDGRFEGEGTFHYANGNVYKGQWKANKRHGKGVMTWVDGASYVGMFEADEPVEGQYTDKERNKK